MSSTALKMYNSAADVPAEVMAAMTSSIYPGAKQESILAALRYCQASNLDPLTKPVHIVAMQVKVGNDYEWRDVILPGIALYRTKAHRTGLYAGTDLPEFGPMVDFKASNGKTYEHPEYCVFVVYRMVGGIRCPFPVKVFWRDAYVDAGSKGTQPNRMWSKRTSGQLEKCAEALALRKAFPEELGGQVTAEEMEGSGPDYEEAADVTQAAENGMPQRRSRATADAAASDERTKPIEGEFQEVPPARGEPAPEPKADPEPKAEPPQSEAEQPPQAPGYYGLNEGMVRLLRSAAARVGIKGEPDAVDAAIQQRFGAITKDNINEVLRDLRGSRP